jgi:hypothetical protein
MTTEISSQKLASDKAEAQIVADKLLKSKTQVSSVKTRKAVDVSAQAFDFSKKSEKAEFERRFAYFNRFYNTITYYDASNNITTFSNAVKAIVNTKTTLSKEIAESVVLDIMIKNYIANNKKNVFMSNSQIIRLSKNAGSAYGDTIRNSLDTYISLHAITQETKAYMHEHNLSTDLSAYYNKLNLNSAIVKTRLAQLEKEIIV